MSQPTHHKPKHSLNQQHCAHCYNRLHTQRLRQLEILCDRCEDVWLKAAEPVLRLHLEQWNSSRDTLEAA